MTPDLLQKIAALAGCKTTTSAAMVHCLRQKTEDELLEVSLKMVGMSNLVVPTLCTRPRFCFIRLSSEIVVIFQDGVSLVISIEIVTDSLT